jgi:hypothetical protein
MVSVRAPLNNMSHRQVIISDGTVPGGFLISVPKALRVLLVYKIGDTRLQLFFVGWASTFFAVLGLGIWAFNLLPMFLMVVVLALGIFLYTLLFWLGVGDILLKFAFQDRSFFEVATGCQALDIFEETEPSPPHPRDPVGGSGNRRVSRFDCLAKKRFRLPSIRRFPSRPRSIPSLSERRRRR